MMCSSVAAASRGVHFVVLLAASCFFVLATTENETATRLNFHLQVSDPVLVNGSAYHKALETNIAKHGKTAHIITHRRESIKHMQKELRRLQDRLEAYRSKEVTPSPSLDKMKSELADLQEMLRQLDNLQSAKEKMTQLDYDNLSAEVARLKKAVKKFGQVEMKLPIPAPPAAGHVVYKIPKPTEPPTIKGLVRPLESSGEDDQTTLPKDAAGTDMGVSAAQAEPGADGDAEVTAPTAGNSDEEEDRSAATSAGPVGDTSASVPNGVTPAGGHLDVDTEMPYGELAPFGREDTARELTEASIRESNEMVDQLERAEVAEEKRAVFRALTRLRGAAITSFDGVARSQTGNIDEYNKIHQWRTSHPLHHLADEESDVSHWAFPDSLMAAAPA